MKRRVSANSRNLSSTAASASAAYFRYMTRNYLAPSIPYSKVIYGQYRVELRVRACFSGGCSSRGRTDLHFSFSAKSSISIFLTFQHNRTAQIGFHNCAPLWEAILSRYLPLTIFLYLASLCIQDDYLCLRL